MKIIDEREMPPSPPQKKAEKDKGVTQAIVKGWKLNDFIVHLS